MGLSEKQSHSDSHDNTEVVLNATLDQNEIRRLETLFNEEQYAELEVRVNAHVHNHPGAHFLFNILGLAQAGQQKFEDAIESFSKVIAAHPQNTNAFVNLGRAHLNMGDLEAAVEDFRQALKLDPSLHGVHKDLGAALNNLKEFQDAITHYQLALEHMPDDGELLKNLGIAYENLGFHDKAIAAYEDALAIDETDSDLYFKIGSSHLKQESWQKAIDCFDIVLEQDPVNYDVHINLGVAYNNLDDFKLAEKYFSQAVALDPENPGALCNLGSVLQNQKDYEKAASYYEQALKIDPENAEVHHRLAVSYSRLSDDEAAVKSYRNAIHLNPESVDALCNLGISLNNIGDYEQALQYFDRALEIDENNTKALFYLGFCYSQLNRYESSARCFQKVIALDDSFLQAHINLGVAYRNLGKTHEALKSYQSALETDPDCVQALCHLADTLSALRVVKISSSLRKQLIACLENPAVASVAVNQAVNRMLLDDLDHWMNYPDIDDDILLSLNDRTEGLLNVYLKHSYLTDLQLESFLTNVRSSLLHYRCSQDPEVIGKDEVKDLLRALAHQGFQNEFIWHVTEEEKELVSKHMSTIVRSIKNGDSPDEADLHLLASYTPLYNVDEIRDWALEAYENAETPLKELLRRQVIEPEQERILAQSMEQLTPIDDEISAAVQSQYEENPYPRWDSITKFEAMPYTASIQIEIAPNRQPLEATTHAPRVLIAGCGTGKQPISSAIQYENSTLVAIDLSRSSLAYAARKARELDVQNIQFAQADILELPMLNEQFDLIECCGVLHHMHNPEAGLKSLLSILKPGGYIKLGLYSEIARQSIVQVRNMMSDKQIDPSTSSIQKFRHELQFREPSIYDSFAHYNDFYTTSTVRDLLLHVQEHRFTVEQIQSLLTAHSLEFMGFSFRDAQVKLSYRQIYPQDPNCTNLKNWSEFEALNPGTFANMYVFWCRTPER